MLLLSVICFTVSIELSTSSGAAFHTGLGFSPFSILYLLVFSIDILIYFMPNGILYLNVILSVKTLVPILFLFLSKQTILWYPFVENLHTVYISPSFTSM